MLKLQNYSLKIQMLSILTLAMGCAMLGHRAVAYWMERQSFDERVLAETFSLAEVMGDITAAALVFDAPASATENLSKLASRHDVACAWLFDKQDQLYATYERQVPDGLRPVLRPAGGYFDVPGYLCVYKPIDLAGERVGVLCLVINLSPSLDRFRFNNFLAAGLAMAAVLFALALFALSLRIVLKPVSSLSQAVQKVSVSQDYSIRVPVVEGRSDVADLIDVFNEMLEQIQTRDVAIRKNEKLLRGIIDQYNAPLSVKHLDGRYVLVNRRFQEVYDVKFEAVQGRTDEECFAPALASVMKNGDREVRDGGVSQTAEFEKLVDGVKRTFLSLKFPLLDAQENVFAVCDFATDVTDHIKAVTALRESEARYKILVEHAPEAVLVLDVTSGLFVESNPNARTLFGLPAKAIGQLGPWDLSFVRTQDDPLGHRAFFDTLMVGVLDGETVVSEWTFKSASGDAIPCEMRWVRLPAEGRSLVRGSITDISDRKKMEAQLALAQQLESIGRLAGGVAHDFNNILTAVVGCADMCARTLPAGAPGLQKLDMLKSAAERGATLSDQLLGYARKQVNHPVILSINDVLTGMQKMLPPLIGEDVEVAFKLEKNLRPVRFDFGQLEQVIMNLAVNARDAMPDGGRLLFKTSNTDREKIGERAGPDLGPGDYVNVSIQDTGEGIPPELYAKVFEPFFTTKEVGKGTGLGLATCYGIVKQHGGEIHIHSEMNVGTRFEIFLPASKELPQPVKHVVSPAKLSREAPAQAQSIRILLVEDDEILRELGVDVLSEEGFQMFSAKNGEEALAVARKLSPPIQLLITDVVMPKMGGKELVDELQKDFPDLNVIFISGYPRNHLGEDGILDDAAAFLNKPYLLDQLVDEIYRVLSESSVSGPGQ